MSIKRVVVTPDNEQHWLSMRKKNLNSTDIASLFGCSPYKSEFDLWHEKMGNIPDSFKGNERMLWGQRLEPVVAQGIAKDNNFDLTPFKDYIYDADLKIGSSFDFKLHDEYSNEYILEIKCVDFFAFKEGWIIDGDEIEAPAHIELQVQHQMLIAGIDVAIIGVLIGGNRCLTMRRTANKKIHQLILRKSADFWESIEQGIAPEPDYETDADTVIALNSFSREGKFIDATDRIDVLNALANYNNISSEISALEKTKDAKKAELFQLIQDAEKVIAGKYTLSAKVTKDNPGTMITVDMVGTIIGARKGYRMCKISVKKEVAA